MIFKDCMGRLKRYTILFSGLSILMVIFISLNSFSQSQAIDFERMVGTRFVHQMRGKEDSLSSNELIELRDGNGIPVWFSRDIFKNVCLTGECRMVRLRLYWNGAGNYLGFQVPPDFPLTKTDHSVFNHEDYQKLNRILSDSVSILKGLKQKDLIIEKKDKNQDKVDAYSGATQPSIYEYVVRNAVYTCYTLWHTVYGPTRKNILSILEERVNKKYLQKVFDSKDSQYRVWAIDFIGKHQEYHSGFYPAIINLVKSNDRDLAQKAISYFTSVHLKDTAIQVEMARAAGEATTQTKFEIIWKLSALQEVCNEAILIFLELYEDQQINTGLLGYVCKLIRSDNMKDPRIVKKLKMLSKDENRYVSNMMQKKLLQKK